MADFQFPNFQAPPGTFPFDNLPQQLQRTFTAMPTASYGRWNGTGVSQDLGYPAGINPGPPAGYGGGLLGGGTGAPPNMIPPAGTGGGGLLGGTPPGVISAGSLPPGPGGGMPGFTPNQGAGYSQMKADTLNQLTAARRAAVQQKQSAFNPESFMQTFNSLPTDEQRFAYFRSQPYSQANALLNSLIPNFGQWVNEMSYNRTLGGAPVSGVRSGIYG